MALNAFFGAGDPESGAAVGIRAGDETVAEHPVVWLEGSLLHGKQGKQGAEAVHGKPASFREHQVFPLHQEVVSYPVTAHEGLIPGLHFHF
jgi:hypothetical protein